MEQRKSPDQRHIMRQRLAEADAGVDQDARARDPPHGSARASRAASAVIDIKQHIVMARVVLHRLGQPCACIGHSAAPDRATSAAMSGSKSRPETSFTESAPAANRLGHRGLARVDRDRDAVPLGAQRGDHRGGAGDFLGHRHLQPRRGRCFRRRCPASRPGPARGPASPPPRAGQSGRRRKSCPGVTLRIPMIEGGPSPPPQPARAARSGRGAWLRAGLRPRRRRAPHRRDSTSTRSNQHQPPARVSAPCGRAASIWQGAIIIHAQGVTARGGGPQGPLVGSRSTGTRLPAGTATSP